VRKYGGTRSGRAQHPPDAMDYYKKLEKKSEITEDDLKNVEKDLQKLTDDSIREIDKLTEKKEKELFEI
jgi:ribosome recycling factor